MPADSRKRWKQVRTNKEEEMSDTEFLIQYLDIINSQIKQTEEQLKGARLHRRHIISIMRKLRKNKKMI